MIYFSNEFMDGLKTKSETFQCAFLDYIHNVHSYFDSMIAENDDETTIEQLLAEMDEYEEYCKVIESAIVFAPHENIICPIAMSYVGDIEKHKTDNIKSFAELMLHNLHLEINEPLMVEKDELIDSLRKIKILFIGIRCKEGDFTDDDITALLLYLNLVMRGNHPNIKIKRNYTSDGFDSEWLILGLR